MKLETLAKRIATKTDCPELGHYILTGELPETLQCINWTGAVTPKKPKVYPARHRNGETYPVERQPAPVIVYNGKQHKRVPRLLYELVYKPDPAFFFRMRSLCNNPICLNPRHWEANFRGQGQFLTGDIPEFKGMEEEWTMQEVEEMVEISLEGNPKTWDEIMSNPMMEGAPPDLVRECLLRFNKEHLTK